MGITSHNFIANIFLPGGSQSCTDRSLDQLKRKVLTSMPKLFVTHLPCFMVLDDKSAKKVLGGNGPEIRLRFSSCVSLLPPGLVWLPPAA